MAGLFGNKINNRSEFIEQLRLARKEFERLAQRLPYENPLAQVGKQIEAVVEWTANGRSPTLEQRKSIDMGLRMFREYEMTDDAEIRAFRDLVSGIDSYVTFWPTDKMAADPNNDDKLFLSDLD